MARVHVLPTIGPSRTDLMNEDINQTLGKGLGGFLNSFMANKSLDNVLKDPNYENMSLSQKMNRLTSALEPFGEQGKETLAKRLQIMQQEQHESQQKTLSNVFEKFQKGERLDQKDLQGLPVDQQFKILDAQNQQLKFKAENNKQQRDFDNADKLADQRGFPHLKGQGINFAQMDKMTKPGKEPRLPPKSEYDKLYDKKKAESVFKAEEEIPKLKNQLENLDTLEKMVPKVTGMIKGPQSYFGFGNAAEFNELSHSLLDIPLKIFNPSGPIAHSKLESIKNIYMPKASDPESVIRSKIKGNRLLAQQALSRAQDKVNMYAKYENNPPEEIEKAFNKESESILDELTKQQQQRLGVKSEEKQKGPEGKIRVKNKQTGQTGWVTPFPGIEGRYDIIK